MKNQTAPWFLLFGRTILFAIVQSIFALGFFLAGSPSAWTDSEAWWMMGIIVTNFICLAAIIRLFHAEDKKYWDIFRIDQKTSKAICSHCLALCFFWAPSPCCQILSLPTGCLEVLKSRYSF